MPSSLIRGRYVIARAGSDAESSTVITDGANTITLLNVNLADLDVNDFIF